MVTLTTFLIPFIHIYALHFSKKASHYLLQKGRCFRFFFSSWFPCHFLIFSDTYIHMAISWSGAHDY